MEKFEFLSVSEHGEKEEMRDEEILEKSLQNPRLFELIVDKYRDVFLRTVGRVLKNKEEAEDVCQEAFVKIYFNAKKFQKREGVEFKSWAFRVLLNCAFTHYKKMKRNFTDMEYQDQLLYSIVDPNPTFKRNETKDEIESVIEKMPEELGNLLKEHYLNDRPYAEIAAEEGISINALKMKLFRARKGFKKVIEETN